MSRIRIPSVKDLKKHEANGYDAKALLDEIERDIKRCDEVIIWDKHYPRWHRNLMAQLRRLKKLRKDYFNG